jgi:hypothetical protein
MRRFSLAASVIGVSFATLPCAAQPLPLGEEFRVNTYTAGAQITPVVAELGAGVVIAWSGPGTGDPTGIFAQRFDGAGPLGAQFLVNSSSAGIQTGAEVASRSNGEFVIVWSVSATGFFEIRGRRFDSAGAPAGSEFRVSTYGTAVQSGARIAMNPNDGSFVVVWNILNDVGDEDRGVLARRYDSAGTPSDIVRVNTYTSGNQVNPAVAMTRFGTFLVAWQGVGATEGSGIWAQRYASNGTPQGSEFRVNTVTTGGQQQVKATVDASGNYLVVWSSGASGATDVSAQQFDVAGAAVGGEIVVNAQTADVQLEPDASVNSGSSFLVAWQDDDTVTQEISARRVAGASPNGPDFRVNTYTVGTRQSPRVARVHQRSFVIVWSGEGAGDDAGIFARSFCLPKGDVNFDGTISVLDVFYLINRLFAGGPAAIDSGDANGDGFTTVLDVFHLINYLFAGGPPPSCIP